MEADPARFAPFGDRDEWPDARLRFALGAGAGGKLDAHTLRHVKKELLHRGLIEPDPEPARATTGGATTARDAEILKKRQDGVDTAQLAAEYGLSVGRIRSIAPLTATSQHTGNTTARHAQTSPQPQPQPRPERPPLRIAPEPDEEWLDIEAEERPWFVPVSIIFDAPPVAGVWHRADGAPLLIAEAVNLLVGHTGTGKTWGALLAIAEVLDTGGRAYWHNLDDFPRANVADKLTKLGLKDAAHDEDLFRYGEHDIDSAPQRLNIARWLAEAADNNLPALYVLDTVERAGCPPDGSPIGDWWNTWIAPFERTEGVSLLLLDHLPRYTDDRGGAGGSGSQAKGARISGASFITRGTWPNIALIVDKPKTDKTGPKGSTAAVIKAHDTGDGLQVTIEAPKAGSAPGDNLNGLLLEIIADNPGINTTAIRANDTIEAAIGNDAKKLAAHLNQLETDARIIRRTGPRNSKLHYLPEDTPASLLAPTHQPADQEK